MSELSSLDKLAQRIAAEAALDSRSRLIGGDGQPEALVEVVGRVKWFDIAKGYGFIVPDDGQPDVLLHVTILKRDGYETINEGALIVCEAHMRQRGLQVYRIISVDQSAGLHPAEYGPPRTHVNVTPSSGLEKAVVKWFNRLRGFGFVTRGEDKPDIFVHMEVMRRYGFAELKPGQMVLVRYGDGPKGLMAAEIRPVDYVSAPSSH
jgi:CspA family cold shock protein